MERKRLSIALVLVVSLGGLAAACDTDQDRRALTDEELERELDLAFRPDTLLPTFEDTARAEDPVEAPPQPPTPAPVPARRDDQPSPAPAPAPAPRQPAQPLPAEPRPQPVAASVAAGTSLAIRMNDELSTERSQAGDAFTATLTAPILDASGAVLIPAGATVRGRVTTVAPSTRVGQTATLGLAFETISFGGQSYPLHATVTRADVQQRTRTSVGEQAGKVAAGAAAGAVLGRVIGGDRGSTIRGAAVGAAAGTAIAMGTADVDAVLAVGSEVVIRVDQSIRVNR
jgi:hypothetical protein